MDKDKQIEILEKRVKWLERKVGQLEYENHVQLFLKHYRFGLITVQITGGTHKHLKRELLQVM